MWKKFTQNLPESFKEIWQELSTLGFTPILIGGVPRDFLLHGTVGDDWDMELIHSSLSFETGLWKKLGKSLEKFGQVQYLPFDIIRLKLKNMTYEFSAPRTETFAAHWEQGGHKNFEHTLNLALSFEQAVKRRDFTINSIGLKFIKADQVEVLDPLNGQLHLKEKRLVPAGEDFSKDPIRFLRAIRFSLKLGFEIDPSLDAVLKTMPLNSVSAVHLWNEIQKSKDIKAFLMKLGEYRPFHPEWKSDWIPALKREHQIASLWQETPTKLMLWLALSGFPTKSFQETFNLSPKDQQSFERLATSLREVAKLDPLDFHGEFEEVSKRPEFEKICDVFFTLKNMQAKESAPFAESLLKEFAPGWQYLFSFEIIKDVREIDPPLRAKYQVWNLCQKL